MVKTQIFHTEITDKQGVLIIRELFRRVGHFQEAFPLRTYAPPQSLISYSGSRLLMHGYLILGSNISKDFLPMPVV
jgi:hypothetical protein